jgi:hypothetical protein
MSTAIEVVAGQYAGLVSREQKSYLVEYFRLRELPNEELMDERVAIAYLTYTGERI